MTIHEAIHVAWEKACDYDGIEHDSSFVVWSEDNPHAKVFAGLMSLVLQQAQLRRIR